MKKRTLIIFGLILLLGLPVFAAKSDLLFLLPGFPGTSSQAQPFVDQMLRKLETKLKWNKGEMTGAFIPDGTKAMDQLNSVTPGIAVLGPSVYAQASSTKKMTVIAKLFAGGKGEQTYYVITRKDGPTSLKDLKGKKIGGNMLFDEKFAYNVLLDKKLSKGDLTLVQQKRPLRALRDLAKNKIDAALVDQDVKDHMSSLPNADDLKIIFTSKPVPAPAVVIFENSKNEAKAIKQAITTVCNGAEGKQLCSSLTISSITAASNKDYKQLLKTYNR